MSAIEREQYHDWRAAALCAQTGPVDDVWLPGKGRNSSNAAKAICRQCPSIEPCFLFAMDAPRQLEGVFAGMTEKERRPWRRKWQARKAAEAKRRAA